ncbi:hypothetical protein AB4084_20125, partial [Lysobacter sp. 2RAB21]
IDVTETARASRAVFLFARAGATAWPGPAIEPRTRAGFVDRRGIGRTDRSGNRAHTGGRIAHAHLRKGSTALLRRMLRPDSTLPAQRDARLCDAAFTP